MSRLPINEILSSQMSIPEKLLTDYRKLDLTEVEAMIILQIFRFKHIGNDFPTPREISNYLSIDEQECQKSLRRLIQKDMLEILELKNYKEQLTEAYSFEPLWNKLYQKEEVMTQNEGQIFLLFEKEFARPLSPFEIETINIWLDEDNISMELITSALRESVLMGKLNFKYIDGILREWKRKGIRSVEQSRNESKSFRHQQTKQAYQQKERDTSVYFDWLKGD